MGCCQSEYESEKVEEIRPSYRYRYLNLSEMDRLVDTDRKIYCYICRKPIVNRYEQLSLCHRCNKVVGHSQCVAMYQLQYPRCPLCGS